MPLSATTISTTFDQTAAIMAEHWDSAGIVDQTFGPNSGVCWLLKNAKRQKIGGRRHIWSVMTEQADAEMSYSGFDLISTVLPNMNTVATLQAKEYARSYGFSAQDRDLTATDESIMTAAFKAVLEAFERLARGVNLDFYGDGTDNSSKVVPGLATWVASDPTTGTVAGINRANVSAFRNQLQDNSNTRANLLLHLRTVAVACEWRRKPDVIISNNAFRRCLEGLGLFTTTTATYTSYRQNLDSEGKGKDGGRKLSFGARWLDYMGMPIINDPAFVQYGTANGPGQCVMLTTSAWSILNALNAPEAMASEPSANLARPFQGAAGGLVEKIRKDPTQQTAELGILRMHFTIKCEEPRVNGTVFNIGADA